MRFYFLATFFAALIGIFQVAAGVPPSTVLVLVILAMTSAVGVLELGFGYKLRRRKILEENMEIHGREWVLLKLAEECSELSSAILQSVTRGAPLTYVAQEMSHVKIHMDMAMVIVHGVKDFEEKKIDEIGEANTKIRRVEEARGPDKV